MEEDTRNYKKYALLTLGQYIAFNNTISEAKGYNLKKSNQRVYPVNPKLAKINVQYVDEVEVYDLACVAEISGKMQDRYPAITDALDLVDSYIKADDILTEIVAEGLTTTQIDWYLNHYSVQGDTSIETLFLESEQRSELSNFAVESLIENDITIITVSDE